MEIQGQIQAITKPKEFEGRLQIGFMISERWFNISGTQEQLQEIQNTVIQKGNIIKFEALGNIASNISLLKKAEKEAKESWQDDIIPFETLLSEAHKIGLFEIHTESIVIDFEKKCALFKATVKGKLKDGIGTFTAYGDATEANIQSSSIKPHFVRMAETRAIARALRWYTNNAACSDVETEKGEVKPIKKK